MGEVYFVRHGQASFGATNYDKLSDLGHQQSEWLGAYFADTIGSFDKIVSGDLQRHRETLSGIRKSVPHAEPIEDARLNEMSFFVMEKSYRLQTGEKRPGNALDMERQFIKIMQAWEANEIADAPESFADFQARILSVVSEHTQMDQTLLIVSSGGPMAVLMRHVLGLDIAAMTELILGTHNASVTCFRVLDKSLRLKQFNGVAHLERPDRRHALTYL